MSTDTQTETPDGEKRIGANSGHGHVWARPDGVRARCGGPAMCSKCAKDAAMMEAKKQQQQQAPDGAAIIKEMTEHDLKLYRQMLSERDKEIHLLRQAIQRYGDPSRMATVEPMELQQAIDRAFEQPKDTPQ